VKNVNQTKMTKEKINNEAIKYEFANGINGFREGVLWTLKQIELETPPVASNENILVDLNTYITQYNNQTYKLPRQVTKLVHYFVINKGKACTREMIIRNVWRDDICVGERTVDVHVCKIKIALDKDCIQAVPGIGYKWIV
jgi:DNA-binding response OmpR family regulator